jgi:hypothetical protein
MTSASRRDQGHIKLLFALLLGEGYDVYDGAYSQTGPEKQMRAQLL